MGPVPESPTVASILTPPGRGGIAVIVLAGPRTMEILREVFRPWPSHRQGGPGRLQLGHLLGGGEVIDEAVVHGWGEAAEINVHGGPAVAKAVMELLAAQGAVVAASQENVETFALAHPRWNNPAIGKEMLDALPLASSALVVSAVSRQWSAGLSALARRSLDSAVAGKGESRLAEAARELRAAAEALAKMNKLLEPAEVVLAGPPNAGKSTLANALVGRGVSIVHHAPGTTRDWVRELALIDGLPIWVTDTAGIWESPPEEGPGGTSPSRDIEVQAVLRARQRLAKADLVVLLCGEGPMPDLSAPDAAKVLRVAAKCDIRPAEASADVAVSAHTGQGLAELKSQILRRLGLEHFEPAAPMAFTSRQAQLLKQAAEAIDGGRAQLAEELLRELLGG